jgi:integrase
LSRDSRIETREARSRLKARKEPYWRSVSPGLAIGYYKGPRGGVWYRRQVVGGRYQKTRLGVADDRQDADGAAVLDYKQAHDKAAKEPTREARAAAGLDLTVSDAMRDYLDWYAAHRKPSGYQTTKITVNAHIDKALGKLKVAELTGRELRAWHQKLGRCDRDDPDVVRRRKATANRVLTVLKAGLNHAWAEGAVPSADAWRRVKPFRNVERPRVRYLSLDECTRLLNAAPDDFRRLVRAALLTGCRFGELAALRVDDYLVDAGALLLRDTKAGGGRHVPLSDEGRAFFETEAAGRAGDARLLTRADGSAWGKSYQIRPMREACAIAGIVPPASFHDLRHTYASHLAMRGVPLQVIAAALGHSDTRMTERHYAHLQPSYISDTIRAHLPSFGGGEGAVVNLAAERGRRQDVRR